MSAITATPAEMPAYNASATQPLFQWPVAVSPTSAPPVSRFGRPTAGGIVPCGPYSSAGSLRYHTKPATVDAYASYWGTQEQQHCVATSPCYFYGTDASTTNDFATTDSFSGDSFPQHDGPSYPVDVPRRHNLHTDLDGVLAYYDFEALSFTHDDTATTKTMSYGARSKRLFIGQLPPELPARCLRWLIRTITGVETLGVQHCAFGCRLAGFHSAFDADRVKHMLHDRVLFDANGAWYARSEAELDRLRRYRLSLDHIPCFYLPRHMMTVRDQRQKVSQGAHRE